MSKLNSEMTEQERRAAARDRMSTASGFTVLTKADGRKWISKGGVVKTVFPDGSEVEGQV